MEYPTPWEMMEQEVRNKIPGHVKAYDKISHKE
jgi:hypothetical protein